MKREGSANNKSLDDGSWQSIASTQDPGRGDNVGMSGHREPTLPSTLVTPRIEG